MPGRSINSRKIEPRFFDFENKRFATAVRVDIVLEVFGLRAIAFEHSTFMTPRAINQNPIPYEPTVLNGSRNARTRNPNRVGKEFFNRTARFHTVDWTIRSVPDGFRIGRAPRNPSKRLRVCLD